MAKRARSPRLAILAPTPVLTVTIEAGDEQGPELHYHAGGQGVWVARMAALLGTRVVICSALGGEAGILLEALLTGGAVELRRVLARGRSASYVHDRRTGQREVIAESDGPRLMRHESDELFGVMLTAALDSDLAMLTGPQPPDALTEGFYRRLARDLRDNGRVVVADLTGVALAGALAGGIDLLKISDEEAVAEGLAGEGEPNGLIGAMAKLCERGARSVVISRGVEPALTLTEGRLFEIAGPSLEPFDPRGAGDSMFAALGVGLGEGLELVDAVRLGVAAGALNATRRGLGTGSRAEVERLFGHVEVREITEIGP